MKSLRRNTPRLQGRGALQLRLPERRQDERRRLVPARSACDTARASSPTRSSRSIDIAGGRARGVRGRFLDRETGEPARAVRGARARSSSSPAARSTRRSSSGRAASTRAHVGRHLTLHPGVPRRRALRRRRSTAGTARCRASTPITSPTRASRSSASTPRRNVLAAAFPGVGREHRRLVQIAPEPRVLRRDDPRRRRRPRAPVARARAAPHLPDERARSRAHLARRSSILGEMAFAAGAREVLLPDLRHADLSRRRKISEFVASTAAPARNASSAWPSIRSARRR